MFGFLAMMYYGIVLFAIRRPQKVMDQKSKKDAPDNEDPFSKLDKLMFVIYIALFLVYSVVHVSKFILIIINECPSVSCARFSLEPDHQF